jgi:hypothetical protein
MSFQVNASEQAYADTILGRRAEFLEAVVIAQAARTFDTDKQVRSVMGIKLVATADRIADKRRRYCLMELQDAQSSPQWPADLKR